MSLSLKPNLVSVVMPVFNNAKYLSQSIKSIVKQTYENWELLIVDDCSSDNSLTLIKQWSSQDDRIKLIRNEQNLGVGESRNKALQRARGTFIAMLDSDDIAASSWLHSRVEYLLKNLNVLGVSGSRILIDSAGKQRKKLHEHYSPITIKWRLMFGNPISQPGLVLRNQQFQYSGERTLEDWQLWSKLVFQGDISMLNDHLIYYRIHKTNTSRLMNNRGKLESFVRELISYQTERHLGLELDKETTWYLYRDRMPFQGISAKISECLVLLQQMFEFFCEKYAPISDEDLIQIKVAFWDEVTHLMRLGKVDYRQLKRLFANVSIDLKTLVYDKKAAYTGKKLILLLARNLVLKGT